MQFPALNLVDALLSGISPQIPTSHCDGGRRRPGDYPLEGEQLRPWTVLYGPEVRVVNVIRPAQHGLLINGSEVHPYRPTSTLKFLRSFLEVMADSGAVSGASLLRDVPHSSICSFYHNHMSLLKAHGLVKGTAVLKWYTVVLSAMYLGQDTPPPPVPGLKPNPFTGRLRTLLQNLLHRHHTMHTDVFFNGVLQGVKRGCEAVPEAFVDDARVDHILALTRKEETLPTLMPSVRRKVREVLEGSCPIRVSGLKLVEPSSKASYQSMFKEGGARSRLIERSRHLFGDGLVSMEEVRPGVVEEVRGTARLRTKELETLLEESLQENRRRALDTPHNEVWGGACARVAAVLEPLKVRLITAGDELGQFLGLSLQRDLFAWMEQIRPLTLTNRPLSKLDLLDLTERTRGMGMPTEYVVSGDYKAATDNLHMDVSRVIIDRILKRSPPELRGQGFDEICRSILLEQMIETKFRFEYLPTFLCPETGSEEWPLAYTPAPGLPGLFKFPMVELAKWLGRADAESFRDLPIYWDGQPERLCQGTVYEITVRYLQRNGQLMGSVLSFPVLCMANLAIFWLALDIYRAKKGLEPIHDINLLPVLVNGDDILFYADDEFYEIWSRLIGGVGFKASIGKNYKSKSYAMVNSSLWKVIRSQGGDVVDFHSIRFLNTGLLTGQAKVCGKDSGVNLKDPSSIYNKLMEDSTNRVRTHSRFLHYNKAEISSLSRDGLYNLFVHPMLGGCGFRLYPEVRSHFKWYLTPFQEDLAHYRFDTILCGRSEDEISSAWFCGKTKSKAQSLLGMLGRDNSVKVPYLPSKRPVRWFVGQGPLEPGWTPFAGGERNYLFMGPEIPTEALVLKTMPGMESIPYDAPKERVLREELSHKQWKEFLSYPRSTSSLAMRDLLFNDGRWIIRSTDPKVVKLELDSRTDKLSNESQHEETTSETNLSESGFTGLSQNEAEECTSSDGCDEDGLHSADNIFAEWDLEGLSH